MRRQLTRAFTLVELMVALTGGLIFSVFVFMLTRDVSRFFQQETGLSDATTSMLTGYQRLRADVQRAGFLASPNFVKDIKRCPARTPIDGVPTLTNITGGVWGTFSHLPTLALARVTTGTATTWLTAVGLAPDELTLYGNYTSADQYPVRMHVAGTAEIYLNPNSEELARAGYATATAADTLARIFPAGSILRAVSAETGEEQYSIVDHTSAGTLATPTIHLDTTFPLTAKGAGTSCGLLGVGADLLVNPVNIIRYRLGSLSGNADFAALYPTGGTETAWPRLDLLREELNPKTSVTTPISQELVAEFAVDFRVSAQVFNPTLGTTPFLAEGSTTLPAYLGPSTATAALALDMGPHMIRGLRPRLALRTRAPDRQANVVAGAGLYRVPLTPGSGGTTASDYARVRTLQSLIMTRNTRSRVWR